MAEAIGGGVNAAVCRRALQVVVAVEVGLRAVPIVPLLITMGTRGVAGECVAAGVAGVVAVGLQIEARVTHVQASHFQHQERITTVAFWHGSKYRALLTS